MRSYFEEFEKKYNRPTMNRITVGFSGIDPSPKNESDIDDEAVHEIARDVIKARTASREEVNTMLAEVWGN